jgi:hypothetical protein
MSTADRVPSEDQRTILQDAHAACGRIPPLWDLRNFVAVNPFLGFAGQTLDAAARDIADGHDAAVLPAVETYRSRWKAGQFGAEDLASSARRAHAKSEALEAVLHGVLRGDREAPKRRRFVVPTAAEHFDAMHGTEWSQRFVKSVARWCSVHASRGEVDWSVSGARGPSVCSLYSSWRESAEHDRTLEIDGLSGLRRFVASLPASPEAALDFAVSSLGIRPELRDRYMYRLLGGVFGWASYYRRLAWERDPAAVGEVVDLLAIRAVLELALVKLGGSEQKVRLALAKGLVEAEAAEDESIRLALQDAVEDGFVRGLSGRFRAADAGAIAVRPSVQAVFCIDVRSEVIRRHLEAQDTSIETRGFAGFFGVALGWNDDGGSSARCPVLLKPSVEVGTGCCGGSHGCGHGEAQAVPQKAQAVPNASSVNINAVQAAPASNFSYVEWLGLFYGIRLASDALVFGRDAARPEDDAPLGLDPVGGRGGIAAESRASIAAGILKNMGFKNMGFQSMGFKSMGFKNSDARSGGDSSANFARIVMLCGHEGRSANNPHAAGLDCGACGGHGGAVNARVAAALLNDSEVRVGLRALGWEVPADTHFLPAVHDTSTDEIRLLDLAAVPAGHSADIATLRDRLEAAGVETRHERAQFLGLVGKPKGILERILQRRAKDWSEVRPEWALARNAAFIAARRSRTRGVDLGGRSFLHEYDHALDTDGSVLGLILAAPVVVASWINLQYFGSTVDNHAFGSGDKTLHNRVGSLGVVLGNGGDLRPGLPLQSVVGHDGKPFHEPMRLQVVVEAPTEFIDSVLRNLPGVCDLLDNGWVRLFALEPNGSRTRRYLGIGSWELV